MAEKWANKDALFKADVPKQRHTIPGIGDVWIWGLTCGQKDDYENETITIAAGTREIHVANARALLILWTVHDQHGNRFFADKDMGRIAALPGAITEPIYEQARKLSAIGAGEIEGLVKNSETIRSGGPDTGSPAT